MARSLDKRISLLIIVLLSVAAVHLINVAMHGSLMHYGIQPRNTHTWYHIFTAPFIHGDYSHLGNNLIGLALFGALTLVRSQRFFVMGSLFIIVVSGGLVWFFGRSAVHLGASGWIYGLWSLTIVMAWYDRKLVNILMAVLVIIFYGGMIYGVLPSSPNISYEYHLAGAIAGLLYAALVARSRGSLRRNLA
ncbi:rhomboid family intramembrane serine protease [Halioxenophilus sp. WMMB6]|uniref:rhomboid family intramembrane serine protease n=1 Tax=Halioxenophilus sp. WMMB6 TaxID=3073815 RepID=UPI00295EABB5|nr:rhomboid family intramembrane serine protease [Halioxenophilus sp. WMMB6]